MVYMNAYSWIINCDINFNTTILKSDCQKFQLLYTISSIISDNSHLSRNHLSERSLNKSDKLYGDFQKNEVLSHSRYEDTEVNYTVPSYSESFIFYKYFPTTDYKTALIRTRT